MRKRFTIGFALVVALVTGAVVGTMVPAASQQSGRETLAVCEKDNSGYSKDIDADDDGDFSPGDYSTQVVPMFDPDTGRRLGRDVGVFTFIKPIGKRNGWFQFTATAIFGNGKLTAMVTGKFSQFDTKDGATFPITGGTGHYRNASGVVTAKAGRCDGSRGTRITFDIKTNN